MTSLLTDARSAVRSLLRAPAFTAVTAGTLALGVGAVASIFAVLNGVLLEPLPFQEEDRLVSIWHRAPGWGFDQVPVALNQWATYRDEGRTFEEIALWNTTASTVAGPGDPERVWSLTMTHELLPILGVEPILGRSFTAEDDTPDAPATVMLAHGYWQRSFGGDPSAVGRTLRADGVPRTIIGVLPPEVEFPQQSADIYLPYRLNRERIVPTGFNYQAIARLAPGVSVEQANADVNRMIPMATERYGGTPVPILEDAGFEAFIRPLKQDYVGDVGGILWILFGAVGIVLLIACANGANLLLVRVEGRHREMAVRTAIGASRRRIARQLLAEGVGLGIVAGGAGLALTAGAVQLVRFVGPENLPRLHRIVLGPEVVAVALAVSVVSGVLLSLIPLARAVGVDLISSLKEGGRGGGAGRERARMRRGLVVGQMALALVLLAGSGLMLRSFQALRSVEPGFSNPEQVATFRIAVPAAEIADLAEVARVYETIAAGIRQIPGVASVAAASSLPMEGFTSNDAVELEDEPLDPGETPPVERFKWVSGEYFETLGIPLIAGRAIEWEDVRSRGRVAVVTQNFAERHWGSPEAALGRRVTAGSVQSEGFWHEIVGVAGNVHDAGVDQTAPAVLFWPVATPYDPAQFTDVDAPGIIVPRSLSYAVRTRGASPATIVPEVRAAVLEVNPNLALAMASSLDRILARSMARTSFTMILLLVAAGVALALSLIGIYGVISYVVAQRTREIGVRLALGADPGVVRRMVLGEGALLAGTGIVLGLVAAIAATRLMSSLLFGVEPTDPGTFVAVAGLLIGVALVASYLPARRASRIDPLEALRFE